MTRTAERVGCVSLIACRREQHEREHCARCRVLTCRYALDADRTCWACEAPGFYQTTKPVRPRNPWTTVALETAVTPARRSNGRRHGDDGRTPHEGAGGRG